MFSRFHNFSLDFLVKFLFSRRTGALIKIISWLSIMGIGTGVCSLIIVLSVMNGFNKSIRARKFSVEPHLVAYFGNQTAEEIKGHAGIAWLRAQDNIKFDVTETQDVILRTSDGFVQGGIAQGVSAETLKHLVTESQRQNKDFVHDPEEYGLKEGEVLVGAGLGDIMGLFENDRLVALSPESLLGPKESVPQLEHIRVKNFINTRIDDIDSQKIFYIVGQTMLRLRDTASLERTVEIRLPNPENYEGTKAKLESFGLSVDSWKERNSNLFYSLKLEKFVIGLLLGLSTLIASFSLVTVMVLVITQKRKDLGLLLALGFAPASLRNVFVKLGVMMAGVGIIGGLTSGLIASFIIGRYSQGLLPAIYEETNIPTEIDPVQVVMVLLIAGLFSMVTTWVSVRKISNWEPVQALRS